MLFDLLYYALDKMCFACLNLSILLDDNLLLSMWDPDFSSCCPLRVFAASGSPTSEKGHAHKGIGKDN